MMVWEVIVKMTVSNFIADHFGRSCKYNKSTSTIQCVDLAKALCAEVLNAYNKYPSLKNSWAWGNAIDWALPNPISSKMFTFSDNVKNTPAGSLVIFKTNSKYGHIAVSTGFGTDSKVITLDQNWSKTPEAQFVAHDRSSIKKVLIPK